MATASKKRHDKAPDFVRQASSGSTGSAHQVQATSGVSAHSQALFLQKVSESNEAVKRGDFRLAVQAYTDAIVLDPTNHILYTNRSTAFAKIQQFQKSLLDARKARELNPKWAKAYIREGSALQQLGQHADALAAFASGLAVDAQNASLLSGLTEAAIKCPLKETLEPIFQQLQKLKLDKSPFVIISVIGQELLQAGHYHASVQMLESALKIGTCSLKLRGSVFSALSSAYWGFGNIDQAITYMQKDLQVAKGLGDTEGECRAYGNLGSAYFSKGHYKEALSHDRFQLVLAMRLKDRQTATVALGRLGHVYTAIGDYPNALQSHKQSVLLLKQSNEKLLEAREIGNVGAVYLAMGNFESAVECHLEHLKIAKGLKNSVEEARAYSNLGSAYHYKRNYEQAIVYHKKVLYIAEHKGDKSLEARAYAGLGHAARCMMDYNMAKTYHEKQLDNALQTRDKVAEGRACSNLGIIFHQLAEYEAGLKLHKVHLSIARDLGDRASQGRSLGNIGNAYCAIHEYEQAIKYHKQELAISTEVNDRHSEMSTHGNLAVAYQALKMMDSAHQHYVAHLNISRELKDPQSEGRAVCNLGNFHSSRGEYTNSIPYYEQYLMLSQELHDAEGEAKACFCLGYAHFALGNYVESVRYYQQDLSIAQELKDQLGIARAYCNLGLAHKALNNFKEALECQKKCLTLMTSLKNLKGRFRSMGNIGDIHLKTSNTSEAIKFYEQQLHLAKQCNNNDMLATANGALGAAHRVLAQYDKALGFHTQELSIRQDMKDMKGECRAHGNLGSVHMCLAKYMNAYKCYEEQLEKSRELQDSALEANACGNLAITKMNMGNFEEAIGLFEQQLAMLEQVHGNNATYDKGRAFGNLGDCYEALGDFDESIKCHEQYLAIAQNSSNLSDQDKAYRGLGNAHRSVGNLQQALVCFEKRLVVAHELNSPAAKASAYGELGCLHSLLGNFEQAISCLQHQLSIAQEMEDSLCEGEAACGLGGVYQQMGEYEKALEYHEMDLNISEKTKNMACQCRAYGNLGLSHESLGDHKKAIEYQEQHLSIAAQMNDRVAKTLAYSSLGRVHHALNNHQKAVEYLRQGLQIAEQLGRMEDEAKIRHRLGLALWGNNDYEECQTQLYKASELFESIRRDAQFNSEYQLSLFDLQTACYQALQRVLVTLKRHHEALVVAERACTRAFIDLLMERQAGSEGFYGNHVTDPPPITTDQITSIVSKQKSLVLYFSVASGFLYSWLLTPQDGVVKFHQTSMADVESEVDGGDNISMKSSVSLSACSLLDNMVGQIREAMGVESHAPNTLYRGTSRSMSLDNESTSDVEDQWEQQLEEIGDKLNAENDRTGFLRIVNRHHMFNSSNYSLGSMFSLNASLNASYGGAGVSRKNSVRNKFGNKSAITALYQLLIEPFEEKLSEVSEDLGSGTLDLILVLQGDLYLIPFSVLRKDQTMEYLFERFNLVVIPSLTSLQNGNKHEGHRRPVIDSSGAVVVGNPKLTPAICQHWHLHDIPASEYEARIVGEILTARPLISHEATKGAVLNQIEQVEVIHFATHISWKLASVILSPGEVSSHSTRFPTIDSDDSSSDISSFDGPSLAEYLLTAADILNLKLHAKLVVLSAGYTDDRAGRINSDGVVGLTRALLSAGAQCVIYCLWPVPDQASKLFMRTLYVGLQEGKCVSQALQFAIKNVQSTKQFSHPSNWGGWVLLGRDIKLSSKVAQMGHAICELLQHPGQCREAMRVLLHLIEKSLQRIHQGVKNSMYTTAQSIENKVTGLPGWKDLLQAVGFRFEPSLNGLPPAVFFPMSDPGGRLTQASASLQALLGLPQGSIQALAKFLNNHEAGEAIIRVMRDILSKMAAKDTNMDVKVNVKLWRVPGCHEFLASLSMDLVEVGNDDVTLRLGKQANKRHLQFALQSLVSVFDTQEAPRSLALDSSSSLESLSSSHSGSTSTSNFSKGSTPPLSPRSSKKKSLFNPAEMEKMRIRNSRMSQGGLAGRKVLNGKFAKTGVNDPSVCLQYQNQIKTMYRSGGTNSLDGADIYVTALSDTDTQNTDSPTLGSSAASDNFKELRDAESYNLSFDGRSDKSDRKSYTPDVGSEKSSVNGDVEPNEINENKIAMENAEVNKHSFERNGETRNSDISDASSASQGIQADKDCGKRSSDVSDMSMTSEGRLTPKNQRDLETFLQVTDESGIVSEATSSNHSETSQQSDQMNFRFDPAEIAQKIMSEVSEQKMALDTVQQISLIQSAKESNMLRSEYSSQGTPGPNTSSSPVKTSQSLPHFTASGNTRPTDIPIVTNSVQSKISAFSMASSAFTSPTHTSRPPPPPVAAKPSFQANASGFRTLSSKFTDLSKISSVSTVGMGPGENAVSESQLSSDIIKSEPVQSDSGTTTAIVLNKKDNISSVTSTNTTLSFSSFRPAGKSFPAESVSHLSQYRPDSTTSTSSYCSSVKSVIYKPLAENRVHDSPCVVSYDSSSEQTSGSGSTSTITPTIATSESQTDSTNHKRDASPALSSCSSASSKSGKQKKKVSFSDSEPSDTPSPLNSSASSSQMTYFDLKIASLGGTPPRSPLSNPPYQLQYSRQASSSSSVDSAGLSRPAGVRPPPPSYQYAIRNSQYIVNRSSNENLSRPPYAHSSVSSSSSLNNSLDEISRVPPQSPGKHQTSLAQGHNSQLVIPSTQPRSQYQPVIHNEQTKNRSNINNYAGQSNSLNQYLSQNGPINTLGHVPVSSSQQFNHLSQKSPSSHNPPVVPNRSSVPTIPDNFTNIPGPQSPRHANTGVTPMSANRGQPVNSYNQRPNNLQFSTAQPTLLRQPLSPESTESYPPPPAPFRGAQDNLLTSPQKLTAQQRLDELTQGQGHLNQGHLSQSRHLLNEHRSPSELREVPKQFGIRPLSQLSPVRNQARGSQFNISQSQHPLPQTSANQSFTPQVSQFQLSNQQANTPAMTNQMHLSPSHESKGPVYNQSNHFHPPTALTNQTQFSPSHQGRSQTMNAFTNQQTGQHTSFSHHRELPPRRNPPVPPARIDSWENMDRYSTSQNGDVVRASSHVPNPSQYSHQNGLSPPPLPPKGHQLYNGTVPNMNSVSSNEGPLVNGNLSTFKSSHALNGPLKRVDLGSDKKSFSRTNVIQASKC